MLKLKNKKMKRLTILLLLTITLLSSCSIAGIDTLLTPPRLNEQEEAIELALKSAVTGTYRLKYPKEGENLSAFTVADIDGDGTNEAIVFYERTQISSEDMSLRLNILDEKKGKWTSVYDYAAPGIEVEQVKIAPIGDSKSKLIVGYSTINQNDKILEIYDYVDGKIKPNISENYSYFRLFSTDDLEYNSNNTANDVIIVTAKNSNSPAKLRRLKYTNSLYYETNIDLSENALAPVQVLYETANKRFYIDMNIGNNFLQTEIIELKNDNFYDLLYAPPVPELSNENIQILKQKTIRPTGYLSGDINNDNIIEIPIINTITNSLPLVEWLIYSDKSLETTLTGYYSLANKFAFVFPPALYDRILVVEDSITNDFLFNEIGTNKTILRLSIVKNTADKIRDGFQTVKTIENVNYMIKVNSEYLSFEEASAFFAFNN
ncbi:hypothetical protein FACS1894132_14610 [Clostridia bacterium]|nr:hypothetical protein FACS1894132_14610 [Clostridia bacterium]